MESEDDMLDAYTSDGDYDRNGYEDDYSDVMPSDEEDDEGAYAFDDNDDFSPPSRLPQSRAKALSDLQQMQAVQIEKLSDKQCQPVSQLKFITEAWLQIVECRRILKWTYAYGYYLPENELGKREFFEYLQGEAESGLERLHQCAEKELQPFLDDTPPQSAFKEFRTKLAGLTSVTKAYFENLVRVLENGLSDVDNIKAAAGSKRSCSSKASGSSTPKQLQAARVAAVLKLQVVQREKEGESR